MRSDLISLCRRNSCSEENAGTILSICKEKGFIENVDKNIDLWFHNNSFRGLYKEKVVLLEMTDRILNVKPGYIQSVQGQLIEETGNSDIVLKLDVNKNAIKVLYKVKGKDKLIAITDGIEAKHLPDGQYQ